MFAEESLLQAAMVLYLVAFVAYVVRFATRCLAGRRHRHGAAGWGWLAQTTMMVTRGVGAGRVPLVSMYEYLRRSPGWWRSPISSSNAAPALAGGVQAAGAPALVLAVALLAGASMLPVDLKQAEALMPVLKSDWLIFHVSGAVIAYGAAGLASALAFLYFVSYAEPSGAPARDVAGGAAALRAVARPGHLPRHPLRLSVPHPGERDRRDLGLQRVGSVLGLGSEGDLVAHHLDDLRLLPARPPAGRLAPPRRNFVVLVGIIAILFTFLGVNQLAAFSNSLHAYARRASSADRDRASSRRRRRAPPTGGGVGGASRRPGAGRAAGAAATLAPVKALPAGAAGRPLLPGLPRPGHAREEGAAGGPGDDARPPPIRDWPASTVTGHHGDPPPPAGRADRLRPLPRRWRRPHPPSPQGARRSPHDQHTPRATLGRRAYRAARLPRHARHPLPRRLDSTVGGQHRRHLQHLPRARGARLRRKRARRRGPRRATRTCPPAPPAIQSTRTSRPPERAGARRGRAPAPPATKTRACRRSTPPRQPARAATWGATTARRRSWATAAPRTARVATACTTSCPPRDPRSTRQSRQPPADLRPLPPRGRRALRLRHYPSPAHRPPRPDHLLREDRLPALHRAAHLQLRGLHRARPARPSAEARAPPLPSAPTRRGGAAVPAALPEPARSALAAHHQLHHPDGHRPAAGLAAVRPSPRASSASSAGWAPAPSSTAPRPCC